MIVALLPAALLLGLAEVVLGASPAWRAVLAATVAVWLLTTVGAALAERVACRVAAVFLRRGFDGLPAAVVFIAALALWPAWLFVAYLTSGPRVSRRDDVELIRLAVTVAVAIGAAAAVVAWRRRSRLVRGLAAVTAVGAVWTNVSLFPAQYPTFHLVIAWWAVAAAAGASAPVPQSVPRLVGRGPAARALGVLVLLGAAVVVTFDREPARGYGTTSRLWNFYLHLVDPADVRSGYADLVAGRWGRAISGRRDDLRAAAGGRLPHRVLLITIDALRARNVGALGYSARETTPFLDELSRDSVLFERAYAQSTFSLGSILSTFTGRYPGALNVLRRRFRPDTGVPELTLAEALRDAGFRTTGVPAFVASELRSKFRSFARGFDVFLPRHDSRVATSKEIVDETLAQLRAHGDERALTWMHLMEVHEHKHFPGDDPLARYDASIRHADDALRDFFTRAHAAGLLDDTLVVIHGDHGEEFLEHGGTFHGHALYEEQIHVPMVISVPGLPGRRVEEPVELVDLVPTIQDVLGVAPTVSVHGDSLIPAMLGDRMNGIAFAQLETQTGLAPEILALVEGDAKVIALATGKGVETYDLASDPGERSPDALPGERDRLLDLMFAARAVAERVRVESTGFTLVERVVDLADVAAVRAELTSGDAGRAREALAAAFALDVEVFGAELATLLRPPAGDAARAAVRQQVIRRMEESPSPAHAPALLAALPGSPSPDVTRDLLVAMAACGDATHVAALRGALSGRHPVEQAWGLVVGASWGDPASASALEAALSVAGDGILYFAYRLLGGATDSVFRDLTIAGLIAPDPNPVHDYIGFTALMAASDPLLGELLWSARKRLVPLPETLAPAVARGLAPLARDAAIRRFLEHVLDHDGSLARLDALEVLRSPLPASVSVKVDGPPDVPRVTRISKSSTRGPLIAVHVRSVLTGPSAVYEAWVESADGVRHAARILHLESGVMFVGSRAETRTPARLLDAGGRPLLYIP